MLKRMCRYKKEDNKEAIDKLNGAATVLQQKFPCSAVIVEFVFGIDFFQAPGDVQHVPNNFDTIGHIKHFYLNSAFFRPRTGLQLSV